MSILHRLANRKVKFILFVIVVLSYSTFPWKNKQINVINVATRDLPQPENKDPVIKSHQNVIFDLGAKEGTTLMEIFGIASSNPANDFVSKLNHNYIHANKWVVYAFETDDLFDNQLSKVKKNIESLGHTFNLYPSTAVWVYDGTLPFYRPEKIRPTVQPMQKKGSLSTQVKCIDFSKFLIKYERKDTVIVKMDLQGAEYEIIQDLIDKNQLGLIDALIVKYYSIKVDYKKTIEEFKKHFQSHKIKHVILNEDTF
jgi:FkbM family methyltransferase